MGNENGNWGMKNGNGQFFLPYSSYRILLAVFFSPNEYGFVNVDNYLNEVILFLYFVDILIVL